MKTKLLSILASLLFAVVAVILCSNEVKAAQQTLTIQGAQGTPGEVDAYTQFSLDNGQTWSQAYLYGAHPWGFVPGTNSYLNCGPNGTDYCIGQSVLYRVSFNVPEGFMNPQMTLEIRADNYADVWLNELTTPIMQVDSAATVSNDATINAAVHAGLNEIRMLVIDSGGWVGLNFKITLEVDAPTPPTLVHADSKAPITTDDAPTEWVNQDVTVHLSAADPSGTGVFATYYTVDGSAPQAGTSISLTTDGEHAIQYWSVDHAGNVEVQRTAIVKLDKTAPATADNAPTGWVHSAISVTFSVYDGGSGAAATYYTVNGGAQQAGNTVSLTTDGTHTISYWSVDHTGNIEAMQSTIVNIKLIPLGSNGQLHIDDIVKWMHRGTLEQQDMNGDGVVNVSDIRIMLDAITPTLFPPNELSLLGTNPP